MTKLFLFLSNINYNLGIAKPNIEQIYKQDTSLNSINHLYKNTDDYLLQKMTP